MLYEPEGFDATRWPDSYWRATAPALPQCPTLTEEVRADIAIIGAGYAGLNAALELSERHSAEVVVLEAARPGWGASGRNGGFCCLGGARLSAAAIRRKFGQEGLEEWNAFECAAISRVRDNLTRYGIDAQPCEEGELLLADSPRRWAALRAATRPEGARLLDRAALRDLGLDTATYHGGRLVPQGFGLHPFRYVNGLARAAITAGLKIHADSPVQSIASDGGGWRLKTPLGSVLARQVLLATNGYSDETLIPWLARRILPAISNIMVTRPLTGAEVQAQGWTRHLMSYDDRTLLHYFRLLPDNRLLFGARGGLSFAPESVSRFAERARAEFETIFPQFARAETEYAWNGLVCLTASFAPYIGPVPGARGLWLALGWHGNGVAAASEGGRRAARAMMDATQPPPALVRREPPQFLFPRKWALAAGMALATLADRPLTPL